MKRQEQEWSAPNLARAIGSGPFNWRIAVVSMAAVFVVGCLAEDPPDAETLATSQGASRRLSATGLRLWTVTAMTTR